MKSSYVRRWLSAAATLLPLAAPALGAGPRPPSVGFAAGYEAALQARYGAQEAAALRSQMQDGLSAALKAARSSCSLDLDVVLERAAPTHPTMQQQLDDPALDPFRTVFFNGGAALSGQVRAADGRVLESVTQRRFADNRSSVSAARDPWSDARVAIEQFSHKLVSACKRQTLIADAAAH